LLVNDVFRRSEYLAVHWQDGEAQLVNYDTLVGRAVGADDLVLVHGLARWTTFAEARRLLSAEPEAEFEQRLARLVEDAFVERGRDGAPARHRTWGDWGGWRPVAALFHQQTRRREDGKPLLRLPAAFRPNARPEPLKSYPPDRFLALPPFPREGPLPETLLGRRTWRRFGTAALTRDQVSALLGLTWGVQRWVRLEDGERVALKTSPSGGARHSVEVYLLAHRVDGLESGLYHYDPDRHGLDRLGERHGPELTRQLLPQVGGAFDHAPAVFFMTSVFGRVQWRYQTPRAYRVVLLEAGHLAQTFLLVAEWLGLAPFSTAAIDDDRTEDLLGVDGVGEGVLYATGVGSRPAGVSWAFREDDDELPPVEDPEHLRREP
jgi:SagB-type dehydrogenase family enzyme